MKTKIFCDIANYKIIKFFNNKSLVDGFTTNPSLMRLAGAKNYKAYSLKILKICKKKPISFEVFADNAQDMLKQAYEINSWGKNVYVKIPVVNSKGAFMGEVIKELSDKGIKLNITAVYTFEQTKKIYKKLTNMRTQGTDENVVLTPVRKMAIAEQLSMLNTDEALEITPKSCRLRKLVLDPHERKRQSRAKAS